jgi:transposase
VLVAATAFAVLCSVPGWATIRVARHGAAFGDHGRWPSARQLYRAAGLPPILYESSGRRRDGAISREGSGVLRRAVLDLGIGLWHCDPSAR